MGYVDSLIANAMLYVRLCIWKEALSHQSANFEKLAAKSSRQVFSWVLKITSLCTSEYKRLTTW